MVGSDLSGKALELLREITPGIRRVGVVRNPHNTGIVTMLRETEDALRALNLQFNVVDASTPAEFENAFGYLGTIGVEGVVLIPDFSLIQHRSRIGELAQNARLPTIFQRRESVYAGGLLSYGQTSAISSAKWPAMSTASSRARSPPICRWCSRSSLSWSSTWKRPGAD